jgi:hypothetical protein
MKHSMKNMTVVAGATVLLALCVVTARSPARADESSEPITCPKPDGTPESCEIRQVPLPKSRPAEAPEPVQTVEWVLPPPFGPTDKSWSGGELGGRINKSWFRWLKDEPGGRVDQHIERWKALAASGEDVEIGGFCYSACTLVLAHVPKERLCFGQRAVLGFHLARFSLNGEPAIEASRAMFNAYPQDIRMWLQKKGGLEKMPLESLWLLFASELWQMGYRKCETMPMPSVEEYLRARDKETKGKSVEEQLRALSTLPSVEEQMRALYKEKSRILEHLPTLDKEKSVGRYTCEERYTPGC